MFKRVIGKMVKVFLRIIKKPGKFNFNAHEPKNPFSIVNKNADIVNKFEGESCFIVGCGPSIKTQDLSKLKGKYVIGLSTFFLHEVYSDLDIVANVFTGYTFHKNNFSSTQFINQYKDIRNFGKGLLFFHEEDLPFIVDNNIFEITDDIRFYKTRSDINNILDVPPSIDKEIYSGQNIAVFGIQIAMSLGFKNIYLLGLDHDWIYKLPKKETTKFESSKNAFYDSKTKSEFDIAGQDKFGFWVKVYSVLWSNYENIKKYADMNNISVTNITQGGVLDVFERDNYDDLVLNDK